MTPFVQDPDLTIWNGDALTVLRDLESGSVQCCVTSPPYWGLRDYGVEGQLGLEGSPAEYVADMVTVFRELRRVLAGDGTLWLNLGDSYANDGKWGGATGGKHVPALHGAAGGLGREKRATGLKAKDLVGIPWRVAFALQADGWYLRSDIVWSKPNPMPESVTDRPTKAHEYLFLLAKSERYFYDAEAISEPATWVGPNGRAASGGPHGEQMASRRGASRPQQRRAAELAIQHCLTQEHLDAIRSVGISDTGKALTTTNGAGHNDAEKQRLADEAKNVLGGYYREFLIPLTRNKRSVWEVQTVQFADAHFATFPPALIEPCILAGCPEGGTVLDPFGGSGTTALVARKHGRKAVLIELNPEYCAMAAKRCQQLSLLAESAA